MSSPESPAPVLQPGIARQARGRLGEALAAWFLERRGYRIVERNARLGRFEIDLVIERGAWLVFVEVKYRSAGAWDGAARALRPDQRRRLAAAAAGYAARRAGGRATRFDVVTVQETSESLTVEHHRDALSGEGDLR